MRSEKLVHRLSGIGAAIVMTASIVAGLSSPAVVVATALALAAGRRSRGFGLQGALQRARRRTPARLRVPQPR
ncbi:MAG: hypothetical protein ACXWZM_02570 [Solirubrobacterales bacterium]